MKPLRIILAVSVAALVAQGGPHQHPTVLAAPGEREAKYAEPLPVPSTSPAAKKGRKAAPPGADFTSPAVAASVIARQQQYLRELEALRKEKGTVSPAAQADLKKRIAGED